MDDNNEIKQQNDEGKKKDTKNFMIEGMCVGLGIGVVLGLFVFDNIAVGIGAGMCVGLAIGINIKKRKK